MKSSLARPAASHAKKNVNIAAWLEVPSAKNYDDSFFSAPHAIEPILAHLPAGLDQQVSREHQQ